MPNKALNRTPSAPVSFNVRQTETIDHRIAIWNTLHDGEITVVSHEDDGTFVMFVNIPYVRSRLKPIGDSFVLKLGGLKSIEFVNYDGESIPFEEELGLIKIEILSTDSKALPVSVATTDGFLKLDFETLDLFLDTGQEVRYSEILQASENYWAEWEAKSKNAEQPL